MKNSLTFAHLLPLLPALLLLALSTPLTTFRASAQVTSNPPDRMTYQGFLADNDGVGLGSSAPVNLDVIFKIYNDQSGGAPLWAEQQTVTISSGRFSVLLGEGADAGIGAPRPALSTVFSGDDASDRFIGVTVKGIGSGGSSVDILPRLRLLTSPYAFLAQQASTLVSPNGTNLVASGNGELTVLGALSADSMTVTGAASANSMTVTGAASANSMTVTGAASADSMTVTGALSAGSVSGDGSGLTGFTAGQIPTLDANKITTGTIDDALLSTNVALHPDVALRGASNSFALDQHFAGSLHLDNNESIYAETSGGMQKLFLQPLSSENLTTVHYGSAGFQFKNDAGTNRVFISDSGEILSSGRILSSYLDGYGGPRGGAGYGKIRTAGNEHLVSFKSEPNNVITIWNETTGNVKTFIIDHPVDPNKHLVHAVIEGPEVAVFYRGSARLTDGAAVVELPDYFEALTLREGLTIQLTNVDGFDGLAVRKQGGYKVKDGRFEIYSDNPASTQEFDWEVKAKRRDSNSLVVEPDREDITVRGDGPYTYYTPKRRAR